MIEFRKINKIVFMTFILCLFIITHSYANKVEILEKRTLQTKSFINDNGTITTEIHQIPIHYKKNGKWEDVNPNFEISDKSGPGFTMKKNAFHLYFSKVSNQPQKFAIGDDWITFQPLKGKNVHGVFDDNKALYTDVWKNTDIEYVSNNLGLKENIILKSSDHPEQFSFKVHLRGFDYELSEDGSVVLKDKNGVAKAEIPFGYMEDANGAFSDQVEISLKDQGNHLILTIIPNQQWLTSEERQYPVVIDPTITYLYTTVKQDAYVSQYNFSSKHGTSSRLEIGMNKPWFSNWVAQYSLLKFDVSGIPTDAVISSAQVELYMYDEYKDAPVVIHTRKVTSSWDEKSVCWDNKPSMSGEIFSSKTVDGVGAYTFSIKPEWVKEWMYASNDGVYLSCKTDQIYNLKKFYSKEYGDSAKSPKLIVTYEGGIGLESYWPYKSFDLGTAGEASVNIFTGNLVMQDVDFAVPAKGFDLKLVRTYNSLSNDNYNFAPGWMIDGFSHIEPYGFMPLFGGGGFYFTVLLVDSDGSKHIFKSQSTGKYLVPDGLNLEVIYKNSEKAFYIKDRNQIKRVYSSETGHLLWKEDRYGNKITYSYTNDKLTAITDSSTPPRSIHLGYNSAGKLATITDPIGRVARYGYDSQGHLERYTDFYGKVTRYEYDTKNRLEAVVDPKGSRTIFSYLDAYESSKDENRIQYVVTADQSQYGITATQKWRFSPPQITNTAFTVNVSGPMNYSNKYVMNPDGTLQNKVIIDSKNSKDIRYNYTYKNRRIELVGNGKSVTKYVYETTNTDGIPDLKEVIRDYSSQSGHFNYKTTYNYDSYHNLTSVTDARGNTTTYQWSSDGKKLESVTDAELNKTSFSYRTDGLMETMTVSPSNNEFVTTTLTYDGYGYLETVSQPFNETETAIVTYDYDMLGRLKYVIDPEQKKTMYHYDDIKNGLLKKMTNSKYAVDSSNWVEYLYDENYNLTNVTYTNQLGRFTTSYQYNSLDQTKRIDYPDGSYEVYSYDGFGRLERVTYSNGDEESYIYYPTSQLQFINYSDGSWVEFTYDEFGNRKTMEKLGQPKITYDYDNLNRTKKESALNELPIEYLYDAMDNLTHLTRNSKTIIYNYNKVNKLKTVADPYSNSSTIYTYDGIYNIINVTYPDGSGESFKYNKASLITYMDYPNSSIDASYSYSYYLNGNLEKLQKEVSKKPDYYIHYLFDAYGQLESAIQKKYIEVQGSPDPDPDKDKDDNPITDPPPINVTSVEPIGDYDNYFTHYETIIQRREDFDYDPMGNMILWEDNDVQKIFTYDANNKLTQMEKKYGSHSIITPITYDGRGNILSKGETSYQFNAQGKLQRIIKGANVYSFDYDGDGRRIKQTVNGNETKYILDQNWNTLVEVSNGNSKSYINGVKTIGTYKDQQVSYNYHDHLGSTIGVKTDTSLSQYMYSPFGRDEVVVDDFSYFDSPLEHNWKIYDGIGTIDTEKIVSWEENYVLRATSTEGTGFGIIYPKSGSLFIKRTGLSVKYRSNESMIIYVRVLGKNKNQYYLTYYIGWDNISSPRVNEYYKTPLGSETKDGKWRLLERDLNADLLEGFNTEVDSVLWFCIRGGDYRIDDLRLNEQDLSGNTRKFTDEDQDGSGLYYLRNRYYDPELGRFISQDSYKGSIYDPLSLNQYIYVKNNPLRYIDPSGNNATGAVLGCSWITLFDGPLPFVDAVYALTLAGTTVAEYGPLVVEALFADDDSNDGDNSSEEDKTIPDIKYPGDDPTVSPGEDWEWRGKGDPSSGKGSWYNPKTGESLHPDLQHPEPIGPHWDYKASDGTQYRVNPDGSIIPK